MIKITSEGYIADGSGKTEKMALDVELTMNVCNDVIEGLFLRITESGKTIEESREACVTLSKAQWQELITALQKELEMAELAAGI